MMTYPCLDSGCMHDIMHWPCCMRVQHFCHGLPKPGSVAAVQVLDWRAK